MGVADVTEDMNAADGGGAARAGRADRAVPVEEYPGGLKACLEAILMAADEPQDAEIGRAHV